MIDFYPPTDDDGSWDIEIFLCPDGISLEVFLPVPLCHVKVVVYQRGSVDDVDKVTELCLDGIVLGMYSR